MLPLVNETIKNGRVDGGLSIELRPNALTVVAGGEVANNGRVEEIAKILLDAAKSERPDMAAHIDTWVKLNAGEVQGVKLHTLSIPIPPDAQNRDKLVPLIGETLEVVVGTGKDSVYFAAGREPIVALKKAIEQSAAAGSKSAPPLEITASLAQVAEFLAAVGEPRDRAAPRRSPPR